MTAPKKPKVKPLRYFFYRGDLHKKIHINRPDDIVVAWNYPKGKTERYVYSDVRRNGEPAFLTKQVSVMLNRAPRILKGAVRAGMIHTPQRTYGLDENRNGHAYMWSEKNIMEAHAYFATVHIGRPRNDGLVTPKQMPTASELRAMIRQGTVFYVQVGDEFVPTWRADTI